MHGGSQKASYTLLERVPTIVTYFLNHFLFCKGEGSGCFRVEHMSNGGSTISAKHNNSANPSPKTRFCVRMETEAPPKHVFAEGFAEADVFRDPGYQPVSRISYVSYL